MRRGSRFFHFAFVAGMVTGLFVAGTAWAQPGTVASNQKISDTVGGFTGILDNLDEFGGAVAYLGDLDGAGPSVAALAVGAAFDDDGGANRGAVWILFLAANGTVLSHTKISETSNLIGAPLDNDDEFGASVAFLGDLDGGGASVGAIAVGANLDDDGVAGAGAVYILFLSASGTVLSQQKINDAALPGAPLDGLDEFGGSIASLGDLDGAGGSAHAIAVGAIGDDDGGADCGAAYVLFLSSTGTVSSLQKISDTVNFPGSPLDAMDDFGTAMTSLGDLDGAGSSVRALAVGAALDDDGGALPTTDRGAVYILFLDAAGAVTSLQKISDTQGNFNEFLSDLDEFGGALTHLGDIDGPAGGVTAMGVGVAGDDDNGEDRGAMHVVFLNPDGTCSGTQKISDLYGRFPVPLGNSDGFGSSVAALGDLGGADTSIVAVAVGAAGDDDGGADAFADRGAVYILFLDDPPAQYTLTYLAGPNGTISGTSPQVTSQGGSGTEVTAVPNTGFEFDNWSDGVLTASRTDQNVQGNLTVTANFSTVVGVSPFPGSSSGSVLGRATPNPFHPRTTIPFRLEEAAEVRIDIWGLDGRLVRQLVRAHMPAGDHQAEWDGRDDAGRTLSNGVYFYRMSVDGRLVSGAGKALLLN